jgi:hypothetical protein
MAARERCMNLRFCRRCTARLRQVDALDALGLARQFWPRFVAALVLVALVFFPKPSYGLIEAAAKHRAQEFTALFVEAVFPTAKPRGDGHTGGRRSDRTGAPTGAPISNQTDPGRP